jgi:hypothetical protein
MQFKSFKIVKLCLMIKTKFLFKNFILEPLFQSAQQFVRKGKDPDTDPGGPNTNGSGILV